MPSKQERIVWLEKQETNHIKHALQAQETPLAAQNVATWTQATMHATLAVYYQAARFREETR